MYSFFEFLARSSSSNLNVQENFKSVTTENSSWPNFIFDVDLNQSTLVDITTAISENHYLNHIILDEEQAEKNEAILTDTGFIPLANWACLSFDKESSSSQKTGYLEIKETTAQDLEEWITVASSGFGKLDIELFKSCLNTDKTTLFSGHCQNQIAATALLFYHNNTAGIYHVVTHPAHRNKGFGSEIFSHCEQVAINNGIPHIIAQSTEEGLNSWLKTGMKEYGNFYLFYCNKPKQ